jgi:RNA-directed DNA polymerase
MIITGKTQEIVLKNKRILSEFLAERGLVLNEKKTVVTHIKEGFDFLGFNVRRMKQNSRYNKATEQETVLIIKPSAKGILKLKNKVREIITINKPIERIISDINPVLRGWGEDKRISYHSQATFISLDHWIYLKMKKWAYWLKGSIRRNIEKYKIKTKTRQWNWGISPKLKILNLGEIPIIKLTPLKHTKNPYIKEDQVYFEERRKNLIDAKFRATMYRLFEHRCPLCQESLHNGELVELHHIVPQKSGGKYNIENILPLHQICHQQKYNTKSP